MHRRTPVTPERLAHPPVILAAERRFPSLVTPQAARQWSLRGAGVGYLGHRLDLESTQLRRRTLHGGVRCRRVHHRSARRSAARRPHQGHRPPVARARPPADSRISRYPPADRSRLESGDSSIRWPRWRWTRCGAPGCLTARARLHSIVTALDVLLALLLGGAGIEDTAGRDAHQRVCAATIRRHDEHQTV